MFCSNINKKNKDYSSLFLSNTEIEFLNKNVPSIILNFKYSWFSISLPYNKGISFGYINALITNFESSNGFKVDTVNKIDKEIYIIEIPYEFYQNISNASLSQLKLFLDHNSFNSLISIHKDIKKQIISLVQALGSINENVILFYSDFIKDINIE